MNHIRVLRALSEQKESPLRQINMVFLRRTSALPQTLTLQGLR